jgi:acetyl esterase/lipase
MMDPNLILRQAPPLHPSWLAHEDSLNLFAPRPIITDPVLNQKRYSDTCKAINAELLAGRDKYLTENIGTWETNLEVNSDSAKTHSVPLRKYFPTSSSGGSETFSSGPLTRHTVVYFHGGGPYVGDLDSEDLTCRRICKVLGCTVYSCTYRKMPQFKSDDALFDALYAFEEIVSHKTDGKLIVMGSSSGGRRF